MKNHIYKFRSIMVNNVEKVIPGTVFSKMVIEMDESTIEEHTLELSLKEILTGKGWISNFFLSIMITGTASALIFAVIYMISGKTMEPSAFHAVKLSFLAAAVIASLLLWIFLASRVSVENSKREFVENKRGKGNWRIVDRKEWDKFYRLLVIAKTQRENEKVVK